MSKSRLDLPGGSEELALPGKKPLRVSWAPDSCPVCHRSALVVPVYTRYHGEGIEILTGDKEIVFQCPSKICKRLFIVSYRRSRAAAQEVYEPVAIHPSEPPPHDLPVEAIEVSPEFEEIYIQALRAESQKLNHIAGMGFRKSLEFLIKDFLCKERPDEAGAIRKAQLGTCIQNYIEDAKLKAAAHRATWLGNDETHYVKKWPEKDIEDLKALIRISALWIANVVATEQYEKDMPRGR